jgi:pimeloyl-ACP methyl ester carboxylesterase
MMNGDIVEIGLGVSDTDPGDGDVLYTTPGTHIYRAERLQDGTLRVTLDRIIPSGNTPPNPPVLISPANNSSITTSDVTLTVQDAGDSDNGPRAWRDYQITVSSADGTWSQNSGWIVNSSWAVTLPGPGVYRWSAISGDGVAASTQSGPWTFMYGVPPQPTYTLNGMITFPTGRAASDVTVVIEAPGSSRAAVTTNDKGQYEISGLLAGTYTIRPESTTLSFIPASHSVGVGAQSIPSLDFAARGDVVMLVHGWQGQSGRSYQCGSGATGLKLHNSSSDNTVEDFEKIGDLLDSKGIVVYYAQWTTRRDFTSSRDAAADCLKQQIAQAKLDDADGKVTLLAHSMGGLVSRTYLETSRYDWDIDRLLTFGSPHAGVPFEVLSRWLGIVCDSINIVGECELGTVRTQAFNLKYSQREGVRYEFVGGNQGFGWVTDSLVYWASGEHDGIVSVSSALGYTFAGPIRGPASFRGHNTGLWQTNDSHYNNGRRSYFTQGSGGDSCITRFLIDNNASCPATGGFSATLAVPGTSEIVPPMYTPIVSNTISPGATQTENLFLDGSEVSVVLLWDSGNLNFQLTSPDGIEVTADNVDQIYPGAFVTQPNTSEDPRMFVFTIPNPPAGQWTATIIGGSSSSTYRMFGLVKGSARLAIELPDSAASGEQVTITARAINDTKPISGAILTATTYTATGSETIPLREQAPGEYTGTITAPVQAGEYIVSVQGEGPGQNLFQRQADTSIAVRQPGLQATGSGTAEAVDTNGNGFSDQLQVKAPIRVDVPGNYVAGATLYGPKGEPVATAKAELDLAVGQQTIMIPFAGQDIVTAGINGPYTVALIIVGDGTMPLVYDEPTLTRTPPFRFIDFSDQAGQYELYLPLIQR